MSAGLPNITGSTTDRVSTPVQPSDDFDGSGAFRFKNWLNVGSAGSFKAATLTFDASLSNAIYGNSTTVQPPSLTAIYAIKY